MKMILQTKDNILSWLKKNDKQYKLNIKNNAYEFIDLHEVMNQSLLNELIKKDHLSSNYFENLITEGHQYIINVKMSVDISKNGLEIIPFQFYNINGFFYCFDNQLTSLQGCPQIVGGHFNCSHNRLTSLEYCPQYVGDSFFCQYNQLRSLEYCPQNITGILYAPINKIMSLEYFPKKINNVIYLDHNHELLKYQEESNDLHIQNMSNDDFLTQRDFNFWQQFHFIEKSKKENSQILDDLILDEKKENNHSNKLRINKV